MRRSEVIEPGADRTARRPSGVLASGGRGLMLFVIGTIPILFGAVQPWVWAVYVAAMYGAFLLLLGSQGPAASSRRARAGWAAVGVFLSITLLACAPLPSGCLAWLSPERWALLREAQALSGQAPAGWTVSYAPLSSLAYWAWMLGLAMLFGVIGAYIADERFLKVLLWVLFGLGVLEALYGLAQALVPNMGVLWVTYLKSGMGDARGTYINRNHFAGFLEMLLPLLLGFSLSRVRWGEQIRFRTLLCSEHLHQHMLMLLGLVLMALALLFSKSRGGIAGMLLGLVTFLMLVLRGAAPMRRAVYAGCGLFIGLTLIYGWRIGFDPIIERFLALDQGYSRLNYWRDSLPIIGAHPFGIGLDAFKHVFPLYDTSLSSDRIMAVHLHNDLLQLLVETGWIGFFVLSGALAIFMVKIFGRIRRLNAARDPRRFFLAAGAYGGLAAMTMHSLLDFNLRIPANAVYFVLLMAIARAMSRSAYERP